MGFKLRASSGIEGLSVIVVTPRFSYSGVPLAQVRLANSFARRGFQTTLVILDSTDEFSGFIGIDATVNIITRRYSRALRSIPFLIKYFRILPSKAVVFSAEDHLNYICSFCLFLSRRDHILFGSSRVTPYDYYVDGFSARVMRTCNKLLSRRINIQSCVSASMVAQYRKILPNAKHICIYNPFDFPGVRPIFRFNRCVYFIGRLAEEKRVQDLIVSFYYVRNLYKRLVIIGDGPMRENLEQLVSALKLQTSVSFLGNAQEPFSDASGGICVLTSRVEGMPNVLIESVLGGCIPLAVDCATGPEELLGEFADSLLVPTLDILAMRDALEKVYHEVSDEMYEAIYDSFKRRFSSEVIVNDYIDLIYEQY